MGNVLNYEYMKLSKYSVEQYIVTENLNLMFCWELKSKADVIIIISFISLKKKK